MRQRSLWPQATITAQDNGKNTNIITVASTEEPPSQQTVSVMSVTQPAPII